MVNIHKYIPYTTAIRLFKKVLLKVARQASLNREWISNKYLKGDGIEVGALHRPIIIPSHCTVKYVDRMSVADLRKHYPELQAENLVHVDIVDDGETLATIHNASQDFVIANQFLEHCQDPIKTVENMLRVLKENGVLYLAIPDKRFTFDRDRPVTSFDHLLKDYEESPDWSRKEHFEEWVKLVEKVENGKEFDAKVYELMDQNYSIHYHVWTATDFIDFILQLKSKLGFKFELEFFLQSFSECLLILRKI